MSSGNNRVDDTLEDSLEFYIKFPAGNDQITQQEASNNASNNYYSSSLKSASAYNTNKSIPAYVGDVISKNTEISDLNAIELAFDEHADTPIIMLLGWAGCQDKYLQKYSKIYEERGLITIRYTAPISKLFWNRSEMSIIGDKILKLIYDMNFDNHPIIFHVFSNGGAYLYQHISYAIRHSNQPVQVRGMIFDSAPGERRFMGLYRALHVILGKDNKPCGHIRSAIVSVVLICMWIIEDSYKCMKRLFCPGLEIPGSSPLHTLMNEETYYPQLFLYSKEDDIIPYYDVEKFAKHRENRGVPVQKVCFPNSPHVKHYIAHPQYYVQTVCKFINECLSSAYDGCSKIITKVD